MNFNDKEVIIDLKNVNYFDMITEGKTSVKIKSNICDIKILKK